MNGLALASRDAGRRMTRVLVTAGALAGAALAGCRDANTLPISTAARTIADSADQVMFGFRALITERGLLRAEVLSDTAFFFDDNTRLEMRIVHGVFFNATGARDAVLTSRTGRYDTRIGTLEARGDVVINSVDGRRLETPFVRFDQRLNQISSESAFVMTEPGRDVRGVGFISDPDMQNIRILQVKRVKTGPVALPDE